MKKILTVIAAIGAVRWFMSRSASSTDAWSKSSDRV